MDYYERRRCRARRAARTRVFKAVRGFLAELLTAVLVFGMTFLGAPVIASLFR